MGASLWDKLGLPLLIGVASPILVAALSPVGESAHNQPLPNSDAAAHGVPDSEMENVHGPAQGRQAMAEPELELRIVNGGEGIEHFSDQGAHTPVIKSPVTTPKAQVTGDAARGALVPPVEIGVFHSQQEVVLGCFLYSICKAKCM